MSLMRRNQQNHGKVLGTIPAATATPVPPASPGLLSGQQRAAFLSASLAEDVKILKDVSSKERKADIKRETLIPKYRPYVERLLADNAQHEAVGWLLVWLMDGEMVEEGQELARHCVEKGQKLPENFKAEPGYFFADTLLAWAEGEFNAGRAFEPYVSDLMEDEAAATAAMQAPAPILASAQQAAALTGPNSFVGLHDRGTGMQITPLPESPRITPAAIPALEGPRTLTMAPGFATTQIASAVNRSQSRSTTVNGGFNVYPQTMVDSGDIEEMLWTHG